MSGKKHLERFGFAFPKGSPHVSRTMMSKELGMLLDYVKDPDAPRTDYIRAIVTDNCLGKKTDKNRLISKRYLVELYALDPSLLLFRALRFFWKRDETGHPLLSLLCAYARDTMLRASAKYILPLPEDSTVSRASMETFLDDLDPGRYSPGKLASNAKNLNSTWTQSGHLKGRTNKIRSRALPTSGSVCYALLLGYLCGIRGRSLFSSEYTRLLDCSFDTAAEFAEAASRRGWIVFKRVGDVIEALFPNVMNEQEMEWLHEQN
ncbi:MAG TPA: hypothetical protein ENN79_05235 [Desulfobacteraceae bacterium]|nr:hypothetical protein [Desulfobacteraceae bacterium]